MSLSFFPIVKDTQRWINVGSTPLTLAKHLVNVWLSATWHDWIRHPIITVHVGHVYLWLYKKSDELPSQNYGITGFFHWKLCTVIQKAFIWVKEILEFTGGASLCSFSHRKHIAVRLGLSITIYNYISSKCRILQRLIIVHVACIYLI